jgi:hypothetical protein
MELKLDEGRVYGARYYTVQPGPFWDITGTTWDSMMQWSISTFDHTPADGVWTPGARWYANNAKFWFRNESDRTMFVIKWQ